MMTIQPAGASQPRVADNQRTSGHAPPRGRDELVHRACSLVGLRMRQSLRILLLLAASTGMAHAARIAVVHGQVHLERNDKEMALEAGMHLQEGDLLRSEADAELLVRFEDGARLALRPSSTFRFTQLRERGPTTKRQKTLRVMRGGMRYVSGGGAARHQVAFETETATIGIRGTDIERAISEENLPDTPAGTYLQVNGGAATLLALDGTLVGVAPGERAFGGEPELVPRGGSFTKRPAGRKITGPLTLFTAARLDALMK